MKEELGKWFLDVSKYILTAVIITAAFNEVVPRKLLFIIGGVSVLAVLILGLLLINDKSNNQNS